MCNSWFPCTASLNVNGLLGVSGAVVHISWPLYASANEWSSVYSSHKFDAENFMQQNKPCFCNPVEQDLPLTTAIHHSWTPWLCCIKHSADGSHSSVLRSSKPCKTIALAGFDGVLQSWEVLGKILTLCASLAHMYYHEHAKPQLKATPTFNFHCFHCMSHGLALCEENGSPSMWFWLWPCGRKLRLSHTTFSFSMYFYHLQETFNDEYSLH